MENKKQLDDLTQAQKLRDEERNCDSQDFKLDENQAPKKVQQDIVIATGNLGDVSGCPDNILLEKLADLEHQQWMEWAKELRKTENLSPERLERWRISGFIPYSHLAEHLKEQDRVFARKVAELIAQEILKHKDYKVMHDLGKHGKGERTCLDKVLESLGYNSELNSEGKFFSSQP